MRIPFDIKFRPQIESGEYKVKTRDGKKVRVLCYDANNITPVVALVTFNDGSEGSRDYYFDGTMNFDRENPLDLFIITPEPEMSEFEKKLSDVFGYAISMAVSDPKKPTDEFVREYAPELLSLAREQLQPEIDAEIEKAYKTADEVMYRKGKEDGIAEARNDISTRIIALKIAKERAEEALKDLPRWKRDDSIGAEQYITVGKNGERFHYKGHSLLISDLTKLPGFKEDEK